MDTQPTMQQMIACVAREIRMREIVYMNRVGHRKMSQSQADREIATMKAVLEFLKEHAQ